MSWTDAKIKAIINIGINLFDNYAGGRMIYGEHDQVLFTGLFP